PARAAAVPAAPSSAHAPHRSTRTAGPCRAARGSGSPGSPAEDVPPARSPPSFESRTSFLASRPLRASTTHFRNQLAHDINGLRNAPCTDAADNFNRLLSLVSGRASYGAPSFTVCAEPDA